MLLRPAAAGHVGGMVGGRDTCFARPRLHIDTDGLDRRFNEKLCGLPRSPLSAASTASGPNGTWSAWSSKSSVSPAASLASPLSLATPVQRRPAGAPSPHRSREVPRLASPALYRPASIGSSAGSGPTLHGARGGGAGPIAAIAIDGGDVCVRSGGWTPSIVLPESQRARMSALAPPRSIGLDTSCEPLYPSTPVGASPTTTGFRSRAGSLSRLLVPTQEPLSPGRLPARRPPSAAGPYPGPASKLHGLVAVHTAPADARAAAVAVVPKGPCAVGSLGSPASSKGMSPPGSRRSSISEDERRARRPSDVSLAFDEEEWVLQQAISQSLDEAAAAAAEASRRQHKVAAEALQRCIVEQGLRPLPPPLSLASTFRPRRWLTDASIASIYSLLASRTLVDGLPDAVLLLDPATAFWFTMAESTEELEEAKKALRLHDRQLVLCPVNDSRDGGRTDGGSHWSLLVCWSHERGADLRFRYYDSSSNAVVGKSLFQAETLAIRLAGQPVQVTLGDCAQQENGFDCGVYVLLFSEIIVDTLLQEAQRDETLQFGPWIWEDQLSQVTPEQASAHRTACKDRLVAAASASDT